MKMTIVLVALVLATAVAAEPKAVAPASPHADVLLTFERTACFGTCPIYRVTVSTDGTVEYDGRGYVKTVGSQTAKLSAGELAALKAAFAETKFFELTGKYDCYEATDNPSAITTYRLGGRERTIRHYYGCRSAPADLGKLETKIDQLLHVERWIGSREERSKLHR